jgi:hypothetical protein
MTTERIVRIVAGSFVLLSLGLGVPSSPFFVSGNFLWFTAFVGANLLQSGFTRFCPLELVLRAAGVRSASEPPGRPVEAPVPPGVSRGA